MSQTVVAWGQYPCESTGYCGYLGTSSIFPVSVSLSFTGASKGTAQLAYEFTVDGHKQWHNAPVDSTGLSLTPPPNTTYMEFNIENGTGVPSMLSIEVIQTT